jgi:16S rRNA (cytidine1402-2'-O)-methyltransferase
VTSSAGGGQLVVVATPIGNLGDVSARAVDVLTRADHVCCEDTRRTRALLSALGVSAGARLVAVHQHNERARAAQVAGWVAAGRTVALVSDAGTPAVSDPGALVVAAVIERGLTVSAVPGPSAVLAALVVSGLPTDRFCVEGFLPRKGTDRRRRLDLVAAERRTTVLLEAPNRLAATLADLVAACGEGRPVVVARELTKRHEEVWRGSLGAALVEFAAREVRGEVVVVLGGGSAPPPPADDELRRALGELLGAGDGVRRAADEVASATGVSRRRTYALAVELQAEGRGSPS